jgi:hypothetical protein
MRMMCAPSAMSVVKDAIYTGFSSGGFYPKLATSALALMGM